MARKLGDVLHLLLGEEEPAQSPAPASARTGVVHCHVDAFDVLESAAAWNLAAAHAALTGPTTWISDRGPAEASVHIPDLHPVRVAPDDLEAEAAHAATPSIWWTLAAGAPPANDGTPTLHVVSRQPGSLSRCYRRLQQAVELPAGISGSTIVALTAGPRAGDVPFARDLQRRFGDSVRIHSLPGETALYRSWVSGIPVCGLAPDSREAVALFAIARSISAGALR